MPTVRRLLTVAAVSAVTSAVVFALRHRKPRAPKLVRVEPKTPPPERDVPWADAS